MYLLYVAIFIGLFENTVVLGFRHRLHANNNNNNNINNNRREPLDPEPSNFFPPDDIDLVQQYSPINNFPPNVYSNGVQQRPYFPPSKIQQPNYGNIYNRGEYMPSKLQQPVYQRPQQYNFQAVAQFPISTQRPYSSSPQQYFGQRPQQPHQYRPQNLQNGQFAFADTQQSYNRPLAPLQQYAQSPVYSLQQNYPNSNGGVINSISNLIATIGQTASSLVIPAIRNPSYSDRITLPQQNVLFQTPTASANTNPINQFSITIEEIARNDDYQCIPKVICQMVGNQRQLPPLMGSPIFASLTSSVPTTSAALMYARAALLGITSNGNSCHAAYPKCPRNDDDILYYLNNHRGGFFRYFNNGAAYPADTSNYQYNSNAYQQNQPFRQQPVTNFLQQQEEFAPDPNELETFDSSNTDLLTNLFNLLTNGDPEGLDANGLASAGGSLLAALTSNTASSLSSLNQLVANVLNEFGGNRGAKRRVSKRSIRSPFNLRSSRRQIRRFFNRWM